MLKVVLGKVFLHHWRVFRIVNIHPCTIIIGVMSSEPQPLHMQLQRVRMDAMLMHILNIELVATQCHSTQSRQ